MHRSGKANSLDFTGKYLAATCCYSISPVADRQLCDLTSCNFLHCRCLRSWQAAFAFSRLCAPHAGMVLTFLVSASCTTASQYTLLKHPNQCPPISHPILPGGQSSCQDRAKGHQKRKGAPQHGGRDFAFGRGHAELRQTIQQPTAKPGSHGWFLVLTWRIYTWIG